MNQKMSIKDQEIQ